VKIFEEADKKKASITSLCEKYHVSRKWLQYTGGGTFIKKLKKKI